MSLAIGEGTCDSCIASLFNINNLIQSEQPPNVDRIAQKAFFNNYCCQQLLSSSLVCISGACAVGSICFVMTGAGWLSLGLAVIGIASAYFWYTRDNDPQQLAIIASKAIGNGNEEAAIEALKAGADLDFRVIVQAFKKSVTLFEHTVTMNRKRVLEYLVSIGFNFQCPQTLQYANTLRMVRYLVIDLAIPVNNPGEKYFSPLYMHSLQLKELDESIDTPHDLIEEQYAIIQFLNQHGAEFQAQDLRSLSPQEEQALRQLVNKALVSQGKSIKIYFD